MFVFALFARYYRFSEAQVRALTLYQFAAYLNEIKALEKRFWGTKDAHPPEPQLEDIIEEAEKFGVTPPTR